MWSTGTRVGTRLAWPLALVSRHRKNVISLLVLSGMWVALAMVEPHWLGNGLFSLGAVTLGSDYRILDYLIPGTPSERIHVDENVVELLTVWFTVWDRPVAIIERNYRAKRLLTAGHGRIELSVWGGDDCRAVVSDQYETLTEGLRFYLCVESSVEESNRSLDYHLRLGSVELTGLSETSGDGTIAFFTVSDWRRSSQDDAEHQRLESTQHAFQQGRTDLDPFLKVKRGEELEALSLSEWEALYESFCVPDQRLALGAPKNL